MMTKFNAVIDDLPLAANKDYIKNLFVKLGIKPPTVSFNMKYTNGKPSYSALLKFKKISEFERTKFFNHLNEKHTTAVKHKYGILYISKKK